MSAVSRSGNSLGGSRDKGGVICCKAAPVARAPRILPTRTGGASRHFPASLELSRAWTRVAKPRNGQPAGGGARHFTQAAQCSAAGGRFRPEWRQRDLAAPDLAEVASALDYMLAQQEPYPAVVIDRQWNLLRSNAGAARLVEFLVGPIAPGTVINLADALVAPDVLRPHLTNWAQVVRHFIRSVEADAAADGSIETMALLERLMGYQGVRNALRLGSDSADTGPVLAMHFYKGDASLRLFTTIATLGTPQDVTLQELRIECFFPMDDATAKLLQSWARSP
jgi:MmyB-like transcription regulator ligand binding domain